MLTPIQWEAASALKSLACLDLAECPISSIVEWLVSCFVSRRLVMGEVDVTKPATHGDFVGALR